jgi:hypothetical protein
MGVPSLHGQWDKLICDIWDIGNPDSQLSATQKIEAILTLMAKLIGPGIFEPLRRLVSGKI